MRIAVPIRVDLDVVVVVVVVVDGDGDVEEDATVDGARMITSALRGDRRGDTQLSSSRVRSTGVFDFPGTALAT